MAADTQVWIGDSMGESFGDHLAADIAFVGGSSVDTGCQNIIEPIACGVPTLFGPSIYNFAAACRGALEAGAARQVFSAEELAACSRQNGSPIRPIARTMRKSAGVYQPTSRRQRAYGG